MSLSIIIGFSGIVSAGINEDLLDAAYDGDLVEVKKLLNEGADINTKSEDGFTPLMNAARNGDIEVVKFLIDKGADPNIVVELLEGTATKLAIMSGNEEVAKLLLKKVTKPYDKDSLLYHAIDEKLLEVAKILLDREIENVNSFSGSYETPLTLAARVGLDEIVAALIQKGADINAINDEGYTALDIAKKEGNTEVVEIIENTDVKLLQFNSEAQKPYNLAMKNIEKGDIKRALHWLDVVINDFPSSLQAKNAKILKIPISIGYRHGKTVFYSGVQKGSLKKKDGNGEEGYNLEQIKPLEYNVYQKEEVLEKLNNFVEDFNTKKYYHFGLKPLDSDKLKTLKTPKEFQLVAKGLADKGEFDLTKLKRKLVNNYSRSYLYFFYPLESLYDDNVVATLFYTLADYYKEVILGSEIESNEKPYLKLANKLINKSIEVADKYSDIRVDAEELKQQINQVTIKEED